MHESRYILWQALLSYMWELFEYTCPQQGMKRKAQWWMLGLLRDSSPTDHSTVIGMDAHSGFA